jgi:3-hydroxybutyryl-CoA dehydratase
MIKKTINDLTEGETSIFEKTITETDIFAFAGICGDFNPLHVSEAFARNTPFQGRIAHGMLTASLIDYTLTDIIGLGGIHISQLVQFNAPVMIGDTIRVISKVEEIIPEKRRVKISSTLTNQNGDVVLTGMAEVKVPN